MKLSYPNAEMSRKPQPGEVWVRGSEIRRVQPCGVDGLVFFQQGAKQYQSSLGDWLKWVDSAKKNGAVR